MSELCTLCHAEPGKVGTGCQRSIDAQLAALPDRYTAIARELRPGRAVPGERVAMTAHVHSGLPARVAALSLIGPGGDVPAALHPLVRHWPASRTVEVTRADGTTTRAKVIDWYSEPVLDRNGNQVVLPDDQIGVVPPREWLDMQVRRWRGHFGHHVPPRTLLGNRNAYVPASYRTLLGVDGGSRAIGFLLATHAADGAYDRLAYRGLLSNPAAQAGQQTGRPPRSMGWDIDYLRTWLAKACEEDPLDIAGFAAQLRALHAEMARALGDVPDQTWIGRCPSFLSEYDDQGEPTGRKRPCGASLWQDNSAHISAQVRCPRCHITWETRGHAGAGTAREIRRVWPVDRRRRYTAADIARLTPPRCPGCAQRVRISWRDVTGTRDGRRTWQPIGAICPAGCDEAGRVI